jgi:hypothetical protein
MEEGRSCWSYMKLTKLKLMSEKIIESKIDNMYVQEKPK